MSFAVGYAGAYSTRRSEENWRCDCPLAWPMMTQAASFSIPTNKFNKPFACCSRRFDVLVPRSVLCAFSFNKDLVSHVGEQPQGNGSGANWNITRSFVLCATHAMPELISTAEPSTEKRSWGEAQCVRGYLANSGTR